MNYNPSKRKFIKQSSAMMFGSSLLNIPSFANNLFHSSDEITVLIFSKHLQFLNYREMAEAAKTMGFDGVDLTVRKKGHVLPERVVTDLPLAAESINRFDLNPLMMTTNITDAEDEVGRTVLETASKLNFQYYRLGWMKYPEGKAIPESILLYNKQLKKLALLNQELGLRGGYQNHAGNHVGAPIWDIDQLLNGISPDYLGCQYDIRHATVEGRSSWELGLDLIKDHINTLVIKDFKWGKVKGQWKPINTPMGKGMVDFSKFFKLLKKYKINVPISLHVEYDLGGAEHGNSKISMSSKKVLKKIKKDLTFLRNAWEDA